MACSSLEMANCLVCLPIAHYFKACPTSSDDTTLRQIDWLADYGSVIIIMYRKIFVLLNFEPSQDVGHPKDIETAKDDVHCHKDSKCH